MQPLTTLITPGARCLGFAVIGFSILLYSETSVADMSEHSHAKPADADATDQTAELMNQIAELRAQVAKLQAAVQQTGPARSARVSAHGKMGGGKAIPGSMMDDQDEMGNMAPSNTTGMSSSTGGTPSGCCAEEMGAMPTGMARPGGGMGGMKGPSSSTPGQLGASHLYHIGSTGFFLDHPQHITLTADQKMTLNRLKEKTLLDRATKQRRIDQAEQELYLLTGTEQPDTDQIQDKIREIEQLRAEQRLAFIRAVAEAAQVLTDEQREALLGQHTPTNPCTPHAPSPGMPSGTPHAGGEMNDM
jgi:hypothetical protein